MFPWATLAIDPLGNIIGKDGPADFAEHQSTSTICPGTMQGGVQVKKEKLEMVKVFV